MLTWISSKHVDTQGKRQQEQDKSCTKQHRLMKTKQSLYTHGNNEQEYDTWIHKTKINKSKMIKVSKQNKLLMTKPSSYTHGDNEQQSKTWVHKQGTSKSMMMKDIIRVTHADEVFVYHLQR